MTTEYLDVLVNDIYHPLRGQGQIIEVQAGKGGKMFRFKSAEEIQMGESLSLGFDRENIIALKRGDKSGPFLSFSLL